MGIKEFSIAEDTKPIEFKIGKDTFRAVGPGMLPASAQVRYAELVVAGNLYQAHVRFFGDCLDEESVKPFIDRLDSKTNPITLKTMADVATWLLGEVYGGNPTEESKP